jgi:hypothetical protein
MKYNCFDIRIDSYRKKWTVDHYTRDETEREDNNYTNPFMDIGIYYYPRNMNSTKAFNKLKARMVSGYSRKLKELQETLNKLKKLKYEL